ncbi:tRNA (5-methylaminomethyl-2-thiouridine)(34)-methyltransferase MnmD [Mucilaginibacter sp. FT3.2]|uniref:tRNA (5-methylaminomethyl-2-thiouridine)(34)-methyltransferase MnmD n=1 Tax=Mucilaginibacter sp. FT3.2 TaxID=2723090 RepID=UPI00161EDED4|nr:tRNA (5-methylaminomethyl-2-thiouridine)(34)-methyltransferase MnmD [Mucilaginibacter sp. FT3.2]MBB6232003.1 tRNA U34 5-methylaminomethyl-2-thiouridine-forming methyltransferase MnmC [Mucilaginibacter sp. FT3.2]
MNNDAPVNAEAVGGKPYELSIVTTADGSKTIYNAEVGELYHSRNGALQESKHVFVNAGLNFFLANTNTTEVSILEVGFGTGLNFLLSADVCVDRQVSLNYTGIEAYPLTPEIMSQTGYEEYTSSELWKTYITQYPNALLSQVTLNTYTLLQIANCKLQAFKAPRQYDIVYFDAFAASRQPEMWEQEAISRVAAFVKPGGIFVTYAITGNLKRMLKALDFKIEKIPGAAGKREMLRATKITAP